MITLKAGVVVALVTAASGVGDLRVFPLASTVAIFTTAICWVVSDTDRSKRLAMIIRAFRRKPGAR
jgi:hypothetical protein